MTAEIEWRFEEGIVALKSVAHTPLVRRLYYVRYARGSLRRLFTVVMAFGLNNTKEDIVNWATGEASVSSFINSHPSFVSSFSRVTSIMDFTIDEADQQPVDMKLLEKEYKTIRDDIEDENDPLSLNYFEKYLPRCNYEKCVCTLTNDEESERRIREIFPEGIPTQSPSGSGQPFPAP